MWRGVCHVAVANLRRSGSGFASCPRRAQPRPAPGSCETPPAVKTQICAGHSGVVSSLTQFKHNSALLQRTRRTGGQLSAGVVPCAPRCAVLTSLGGALPTLAVGSAASQVRRPTPAILAGTSPAMPISENSANIGDAPAAWPSGHKATICRHSSTTVDVSPTSSRHLVDLSRHYANVSPTFRRYLENI